MRFRDTESRLIWERYTDAYATQPKYDDESSVISNEDPLDSLGGEEDELQVLEFEPEMEIETEEHDTCNEVIYSDIKKLAEYSKRILEVCQEKELEPWMQAKLVKASDYVSDIWHRLDAEADFANTGFEQSDNIEF